ncbi:MAG TPA: hypothetical protein VMQ76_03805 [Terracidiphilus sp.]|jgi:hypothetical protein|nr:hypothetical protein [Terracidiphilus sp.]
MSNTSPQYYDLIESAIAGNKNDLRTLLQQLSSNDTKSQNALGIASSTKTSNAAIPPKSSLSVSGGNGVYSVNVTPAETSGAGTIYHKIESSPVKGFTSGVQQEALTTANNVTINRTDQKLFFRVSSSYNKKVFNEPTLHGQSAVSSGLVSSAATNNGGAFNQTNFATVSSNLAGSSPYIQVSGSGGSLSNAAAVKGSTQSVLPGATLLNVTGGSKQFVTYNGSNYTLHSTLADALDDGEVPVGAVTVGSGVSGGGGADGGNGGRMTNV